MTASSFWFSTSSRRSCVYAFELERKSTPFGTMQAHLPPAFSILRNNATKRSSVCFELTMARRLLSISSTSTLPVKGGLARMASNFALMVLFLETLSRYRTSGSSTPWSIRFIALMRSIVWSVSKPVNCGLAPFAPVKQFHCSEVISSSYTSRMRSADEMRKPAVPQAGSQMSSPGLGSISSTIMSRMCFGVRNWPFVPAVFSLESMYS